MSIYNIYNKEVENANSWYDLCGLGVYFVNMKCGR